MIGAAHKSEAPRQSPRSVPQATRCALCMSNAALTRVGTMCACAVTPAPHAARCVPAAARPCARRVPGAGFRLRQPGPSPSRPFSQQPHVNSCPCAVTAALWLHPAAQARHVREAWHVHTSRSHERHRSAAHLLRCAPRSRQSQCQAVHAWGSLCQRSHLYQACPGAHSPKRRLGRRQSAPTCG